MNQIRPMFLPLIWVEDKPISLNLDRWQVKTFDSWSSHIQYRLLNDSKIWKQSVSHNICSALRLPGAANWYIPMGGQVRRHHHHKLLVLLLLLQSGTSPQAPRALRSAGRVDWLASVTAGANDRGSDRSHLCALSSGNRTAVEFKCDTLWTFSCHRWLGSYAITW